MTNITRWSW